MDRLQGEGANAKHGEAGKAHKGEGSALIECTRPKPRPAAAAGGREAAPTVGGDVELVEVHEHGVELVAAGLLRGAGAGRVALDVGIVCTQAAGHVHLTARKILRAAKEYAEPTQRTADASLHMSYWLECRIPYLGHGWVWF